VVYLLLGTDESTRRSKLLINHVKQLDSNLPLYNFQNASRRCAQVN
jgi:hypothetical protein